MYIYLIILSQICLLKPQVPFNGEDHTTYHGIH